MAARPYRFAWAIAWQVGMSAENSCTFVSTRWALPLSRYRCSTTRAFRSCPLRGSQSSTISKTQKLRPRFPCWSILRSAHPFTPTASATPAATSIAFRCNNAVAFVAPASSPALLNFSIDWQTAGEDSDVTRGKGTIPWRCAKCFRLGPDYGAVDGGDICTAGQGHSHLQLALEDVDHLCDAGFARRA